MNKWRENSSCFIILIIRISRAHGVSAQPGFQSSRSAQQPTHKGGLASSSHAQKGKELPFSPASLYGRFQHRSVHSKSSHRTQALVRVFQGTSLTIQTLESYEQNYYQDIIEDIKKNILLAYFNFNQKIAGTLRPGIVSLVDVYFPLNW